MMNQKWDKQPPCPKDIPSTSQKSRTFILIFRLHKRQSNIPIIPSPINFWLKSPLPYIWGNAFFHFRLIGPIIAHVAWVPNLRHSVNVYWGVGTLIARLVVGRPFCIWVEFFCGHSEYAWKRLHYYLPFRSLPFFRYLSRFNPWLNYLNNRHSFPRLFYHFVVFSRGQALNRASLKRLIIAAWLNFW